MREAVAEQSEDEQQAAGPGSHSSGAGAGWGAGYARWVLGVYWVLLALATHWPDYTPEPPPPDPWVFVEVLKPDKVKHALAFGGLMALLLWAGIGGRHQPWRARCGIALAVGLTYAVVDELTQAPITGRTLDAADLITNIMAVLGVYLVAVLPERSEPRPAPRALVWGLGAAIPVLTFLALSPWVRDQVKHWKAALLGDGWVARLWMADDVLHGMLAAVLSVVVIVVWPMASRRPRRAGLLALVVLIAAGPGLEVVQHFTGRSVQWQDALAHAIGVLLAMMWWAARLAWRGKPTDAEPVAAPRDLSAQGPALSPR